MARDGRRPRTVARRLGPSSWPGACSDSPAAVAAAGRWRTLNCLRLAIAFTAWIAALRAFSLVYQPRG